MKRDFENKKDFIGADKGLFSPVVKLWNSLINLIRVNKGAYMPVVQLMNDSIFDFLKGET